MPVTYASSRAQRFSFILRVHNTLHPQLFRYFDSTRSSYGRCVDVAVSSAALASNLVRELKTSFGCRVQHEIREHGAVVLRSHSSPEMAGRRRESSFRSIPEAAFQYPAIPRSTTRTDPSCNSSAPAARHEPAQSAAGSGGDRRPPICRPTCAPALRRTRSRRCSCPSS